jgi:hypothetical protein
MNFKTYNIDGDNVYIASPLGLAELNRDHPLFLDGDNKKACEELLVAKKALDEKIKASQTDDRGSSELNVDMEEFFLKLSNVYSMTLVYLNDLTNFKVTDFYKNKTIYIVTSPEAFQVIRIKD